MTDEIDRLKSELAACMAGGRSVRDKLAKVEAERDAALEMLRLSSRLHRREFFEEAARILAEYGPKLRDKGDFSEMFVVEALARKLREVGRQGDD